MSNKQLIEDIAAQHSLTLAKSKAILETIGVSVSKQLLDGQDVSLPGIGKLKTSTRPARIGRNPKTGDQVDIPAKTVVKFSATKSLKDAVA